MRNPVAILVISTMLFPVVGGNEVHGQSAPESPNYLDFGQFSHIVDSDEVGLWTKLKWAGMKYVDAPNANRVVSIYEYDANAISEGQCTDEPRDKTHALLVNWAIENEELARIIEDNGWQMLPASLSDTEWVTKDQLDSLAMSEHASDFDWSALAESFHPVWDEVWFANSCDLQRTVSRVADANFVGLQWQPVSDDRLRWVADVYGIDNLFADDPPGKVIVADKVFEHRDVDHYFAECGASTAPDTLCSDAGLF